MRIRRCVVVVVVSVVGVLVVSWVWVVVEEVIGTVSVVVVVDSVMTGAGAGEFVTVVVLVVLSVVDSVMAGDCVTVTLELPDLPGTMFTLVFRPVADPLPEPPAELDVYALPLLSTFAGPGMTAGVEGDVTFCAFDGAGAVPIT